MNRAEWIKLVDDVYHRINAISDTKGLEYTNDSVNMLANFVDEANDLGITPVTVWAVLFSKHMRSIRTWLRDQITGKHRDYSEPIEGRIMDAIVYLILLLALIRDTRTPDSDGGDM